MRNYLLKQSRNNKCLIFNKYVFLPGTESEERDDLRPVDLLLEEFLRNLVEALVEVDVAVNVESDHHAAKDHGVLLVHPTDTAPETALYSAAVTHSAFPKQSQLGRLCRCCLPSKHSRKRKLWFIGYMFLVYVLRTTGSF